MARYVEEAVGQRVAFRSDLLLIHASEERDIGRPLVIFIHGLNGHPLNTWASILRSSWAGKSAAFDVGLVNYASGWKRYGKLEQFSPEQVASRLASEIRQITPRKVVLIGHSLGGLVAKDVVQRLHRNFGSTSAHLSSIAGVITLCTPSIGSGAARLLSFLPGPAWRDRQALRRHSPFQKDLEEFFSTWIEVDVAVPRSTKAYVPLFSASASHDMLVNAMGAELGVPSGQRMPLTGGHSSALKHPGTLAWLNSTVATLLAPRTTATATEVKTEFNGSGAFPHWEGAYREAITQFTTDHGAGTIRDVAPDDQGVLPDLIVRAFSAHTPQVEVPEPVVSDIRRQTSSAGKTALGISPIGPHAASAVELLGQAVNAPRLRWFRGSSDDDAEIVAAFRHFFDLSTGVSRTRQSSAGPMLAAPWEGPTDEL